MARTNNYLIQANQAKELFLKYDQQELIRKLRLEQDESFLYARLFGMPYRIHRETADISRFAGDAWVNGNSFEEVMTLLDLVCDSREDRFLAGKWKNMQSFGLQFHQNLLEDGRNAMADAVQRNPEGFRRACAELGGTALQNADIAFSFEVFDGLPIAVFFWEGDEEFLPRIRYYWDENAKMYIRYETMYFAVNLLERFIREKMQ